MNGMGKKALALLLTLVLCVSLFPGIRAAETVASGVCGAQGDNLTWTLDTDGVLTVSGTGDMASMWGNEGSTQPWLNWKDDIKRIVIGSGVTGIGFTAFYSLHNLEQVDALPETLKTIDGWAFGFCSALPEITLPESVVKIGDCAFLGCDSLTKVYYGGSSKRWQAITVQDNNEALLNAEIDYGKENGEHEPVALGICGDDLTWMLDEEYTLTISGSGMIWDYCDSWWAYRKKIRSVVLGDGVTGIGINAFYDFDGLTGIQIPKGVTTIGQSAFEECSSLTSINVHEENPGYMDIEGVLFNRAGTELVAFPGGFQGTYSIPEGVVRLSPNSFARAYELKQVVFPDGLEAIGNYAFWNCYKLGEVLIPASVSDIGVEVFTACGMDTIRVEEGSRFYKDLDGILFNADGTELLEFPPRRGGCCYIPDGVKTIGESAFLYCDQLAGVTIPASVTRIEPKSFEYCSNLTDVYYGGTAEQWDRIEIGDANSFLQNAELHPSWKVTPGLVWRYANSNYDPEIDEMQYSEKADSPTRSPYRVKVRSGMSVQFLWMDENGNTEPVNAADLRFSANLGLSRANGSFGILFGNSAGEGYIEYNGSRIDAVVELNELDFYRSPEAAGGNLLYGWNYSGSNNDTVYLVSRMEGSISKVEYEGEGEFECLISHDGKYAAIKPITVPPLSGTNLEFLVTVAGPQGESSRSVSIWFENNRKCGDDLTWTLDEDGVLTISGTGDMWDYQWNSQPWADCKNNIRTVTVASGVTGIGNYAFCDCSGLTEVTLPESLREIRNSAFENCTALTDVYYGGSLLDWNFVSVSDGNEALLNAVLHPGKAITPGLVWRYADVDTDPETYEFQFSEKPDSPTRSPYQATINRFDSLQFLWVDEDGHTEPVNAAELRFTNLIPGMVVGSFVMLHGDTVGEGYIEYNGSRINTSVRFRDLEFYRTPKATEAGILSMWHYSSAMDTAYLVSTMEGRIRSVTYEGEGAFTCTISDDGTYVTVKPEDPPTQPDTALYFLVTMDTPDGPYSLKVGLWFNDKRNCGDDLTWTLDEDGVLTISGTGDMWDYPHPPEQPWFAFANEIQEVVLKPGVTGIGDHAFHNCREIRTVTMPEGVTSIGDLAFSGCDALTDAYYSGTAEQWAQVTVGMGNDPLASAVRFNAVTGTLDEDGAALSWAFAPEDGRLSVTGDIPSGEAVYAAVFGEGGRFLKVIPFTGAGGTADTGTDYGQIKLILADAQAAPRCAFASIVRD